MELGWEKGEDGSIADFSVRKIISNHFFSIPTDTASQGLSAGPSSFKFTLVSLGFHVSWLDMILLAGLTQRGQTACCLCTVCSHWL